MLHQKFRETLPCPLAARRFENSIVFVEAVIDNPERLHGREERANFELSDDDGLFNFELTLPHERGAPEACLAASHDCATAREFAYVFRTGFDLTLALVARAQDVVVVADDNIVITENEFLDGFYEEWRTGRAVDNDFIHEELLHISQNAAKPYGVMPNIKEPRAKL